MGRSNSFIRPAGVIEKSQPCTWLCLPLLGLQNPGCFLWLHQLLQRRLFLRHSHFPGSPSKTALENHPNSSKTTSKIPLGFFLPLGCLLGQLHVTTQAPALLLLGGPTIFFLLSPHGKEPIARASVCPARPYWERWEK